MIPLPLAQVRLLTTFMNSPLKVHSPATLCHDLGGDQACSGQALRVALSRIRKMLRESGLAEDLIFSVRGAGYAFDLAVPRGAEARQLAVMTSKDQ